MDRSPDPAAHTPKTFDFSLLVLSVLGTVMARLLFLVADVATSAGPDALTPGAAWTGLLAFAFALWFAALALDSLMMFAWALFPKLREGWLVAPDAGPSYRGLSFRQLCGKGSCWVFVAWWAASSQGRLSSSVYLLLAASLAVLEPAVVRRTKAWHVPRLVTWFITFAALLSLVLLLQTASLAHAWQMALALAGQGRPADPSLLLGAELFTDFNVLLMLLSVVIIFFVPPLIPLLRSLQGRGKQIPAFFILLLTLAWFAAPPLQARTKGWLADSFGKGGRSVVPGIEGWLFDERELRAITGAGPLAADLSAPKEPRGKSRDHVLAFARALKERGVPLLLIPIPMKAALYPEMLTRASPDDSGAPLYHPAQQALYEQLAKEGIDVQDITGALMQLKQRHKDVFFKQDSHWTPEAVQEIARAVAEHVRKKFPGVVPGSPLISDARAPDGAGFGDLAERLYLLPEFVVEKESKVLVSFPDLANDPKSPITLLGDDFVSLFNDPRFGYVDADQGRAGFAQHLALYLGTPVDAIISPPADPMASAKAFASRFDDVVRSKKLVIWLVPARDLLLTSTTWRDAPFNTQSSPPEVLEPMVPKGR